MSYRLAVWLSFPSLLMVAFSLSSFAIGLIATSVVAVLAITLSNLNRGIRIDKFYLTAMVAAGSSALLSHVLAQQPLSFKQGSSIVGLLVVGFGATTLLHHYFSRGAWKIAGDMRRVYCMFLAIGVIGIVLPITLGPYALKIKPVFPFQEPSHYALAYAQIASLTLPFLKQKSRLLVVLASLLLALGFPNATMLVVAFLLLLVTVSFRFLILLAVMVVPTILALTAAIPDLFIYFADRLTSSGEENLSRLIYIQGWESLFSAISTTGGVGIGFQNLGNEPPGAATAIIRALTNELDLNRADGGFLFAKIGGEFGLVGVILASLFLILSIAAGIRVRRELKSISSIEEAFQIIPLCSTYVILVEMLIRGVGYFSPSFLLAIYFLPKSIRLLRRKNRIKLPSGGLFDRDDRSISQMTS